MNNSEQSNHFYLETVSKTDFKDRFSHLYQYIKVGLNKNSEQNLEGVTDDWKQEIFEKQIKNLELIGIYIDFTLQFIKENELNFKLPVSYDNNSSEALIKYSKTLADSEEELLTIKNAVYQIAQTLPPGIREKINPVLKAVSGLFKSIVRQDIEDIENSIRLIYITSNTKGAALTVKSLGKLSRDIHNRFISISDDISSISNENNNKESPQLDTVKGLIKKAKQASNNSLELVETMLERIVKELDTGSTENNLYQLFFERVTAQLEVENEKRLLEIITPIADELSEKNKAFQAEKTETLLRVKESLLTIVRNFNIQEMTNQPLMEMIALLYEIELRQLDILEEYYNKSSVTGESVKERLRKLEF